MVKCFLHKGLSHGWKDWKYSIRGLVAWKRFCYLTAGHISDQPNITHTTICGTDLHVLRGDVLTCAPGRLLGHEGVGLIDAVGSSIQVGDSVLVTCISTCAICGPCRRSMTSHCASGGWILGNTIDGTQAECLRVPHAAPSLHRLAADIDTRAAAMLSDILPTVLECEVRHSDRGDGRPGDI